MIDPGAQFEAVWDVARAEPQHESREWLGLLVESSQLGIWDFDLPTGQARWSPRCSAMFGVAPGTEMSYERLLELIHAEDRQRVKEAVQRALDPRGQGNYEVEYRCVWPDGTVRWIAARGKTLFASPGGARRAVRMLGTTLDITERKQAELLLRYQLDLNQGITQNAADAIFVTNEQGRITFANPEAERVFGFSLQEASGQVLHDLIHYCYPDGTPFPPSECPLLRVYQSGETIHDLEEVFFRKDGSQVSVSCSNAPLQVNGRRVGAVIVVRDITERKQAEAQLRRRELEFRMLADNIAQLAWMADEQGAIFWLNQRWLDYTGTSLEQMQRQGWQGVLHPEHVARVTEKLRRCFESGETWEDTFPLRAREGAYRWFLSRAIPIRGDSGQVLRWFGTNTDVTEQRHAEQALREADRRKDEFLSVLSHELRNPLAPIRNAIHILDRCAPGSEPARQARAVLKRQVTHLARLVDDLLDVTRIARGRVELRRARVDLTELVRRAGEDHQGLMEGRGLQLSVQVPHGPTWVDGDATRLTQVIGNLLQNAGKFSAPGGRVTLTLSRGADAADISVHDTGVGIDAGLLGRLFEPFVQAERTPERSNDGLGLGLALVKGLVELHGGSVSAASAGPGKGAVFTVRLPVLAPPAPPQRARRAGPAHAGRPQRVLVVDDNVDAAASLAQLVALFGHEAEVAHDGPSALAKARAHPPDVVLCDIGLPGMSGYEVARALRAEESLGHTQLVAVSGYAQPEDRRQAVAAGFDCHLAKPPDPEELERLLA